MATTTNYGWTTPDDTSLVKDGAAAIRTLGSSVDTTTKALNPSTTLGDIEYRSATANTNTRLAIGSTGNVLTVAGGVPTWAAPATAGGMTLISTTSLTGSTVTLSSFSGYKDLQIVINGAYGSNANTLHARFNADSGNNYYESLNTVGTGEAVRNKAGLGDGLSSSSTNVTLRNNTLLTIQRYAEAQGKAYQVESTYIYQGNTAIQYVQQTNNIWAVTTAITSIDLFLASGSFSGGTAYLYGVN